MRIDPDKCCGCAGCAAVCPFGSLRMRADAEGFAVPEVLSSCRDCGKCRSVCPVANASAPAEKRSDRCFAAVSASEEDVANSSSGGVFPALAGQIIDDGGAVAGTAFAADFSAVAKIVYRRDELPLLRQAKYVQSAMSPALYAEAEAFLKTGKPLLFSGTPCQVAAFRRYFPAEKYPNLLAAEVICHGVPSPEVWQSFLRRVGEETGKILEVSFRDKRRGWHEYALTVRGERQELRFGRRESPYMKLFLRNVTLRKFCFECPFKAGRSGADLTMGDFWKLRKYAPELENDTGVSMVVTHGTRGAAALEKCRLSLLREFPMAAVRFCNRAYFDSAVPHPFRDKYFRLFRDGGGEWFDPETFFRKYPEKGPLVLFRKLFS